MREVNPYRTVVDSGMVQIVVATDVCEQSTPEFAGPVRFIPGVQSLGDR